ncbi:MAG TPA: amylo-alpha-1,6-glucosidase [Candidatus Dormibacteraeota bacterium]|nr:amylo-alpha-1,6-glucosidase [Candidatus Dormibacteraeota bacterium]
MADILRVKNAYYVRAASALADDRTRVLKYGDTFAVFNRYGDIEALGATPFGLFHAETRHLSRRTLRINDQQPLLLSSTIRDDNGFLSVDLTNVDSPQNGVGALSRGILHVFRLVFLKECTCYEHVRLVNYGFKPVQVTLTFQFDADFADIFEVRGTKRSHRGERLPDRIEESSAILAYRGLDQVMRRTILEFSPRPRSLTTRQARFHLDLESKEEKSVYLTVCCERDSKRTKVSSFDVAFKESEERLEHPAFLDCVVTTSSKRFNAWITRSAADLRMLIEGNPEGPYPYAGVPWFNTIFGRDGIITALECLWMAPWIAKSVLQYLAKTQATRSDPEQDAEPGKILHETRRGEMSVLKEVPFGCYYGSVDSTPLFVLLAGGYLLRTADRVFLKQLLPHIELALDWIDKYGDVDGDGFVEYSRRSPNGLVQQGWKDSHDSVFHANGHLADPPIALCEVQGYVYAAKRSAALILQALGDPDRAEDLNTEAEELRVKFEEAFWCDALGMYVLALDGRKEQCRVRTSNAGHTLFCKIASRQRAESMAASFMSEQMFSGWGIRTLGASEARYNPMSYHNGSVWPHDNAMVGLGLSLYGFQDHVTRILYGLYEASLHAELQRLPELFCGFHKRPDASGPTLYPVACAPQAWAAGSVFMLLRACLGLNIRAQQRQIYFTNPVLPPNLDEVRIENLRVLDTEVDLIIRRDEHGVGVDVLRKQGEIEILKAV